MYDDYDCDNDNTWLLFHKESLPSPHDAKYFPFDEKSMSLMSSVCPLRVDDNQGWEKLFFSLRLVDPPLLCLFPFDLCWLDFWLWFNEKSLTRFSFWPILFSFWLPLLQLRCWVSSFAANKKERVCQFDFFLNIEWICSI